MQYVSCPSAKSTRKMASTSPPGVTAAKSSGVTRETARVLAPNQRRDERSPTSRAAASCIRASGPVGDTPSDGPVLDAIWPCLGDARADQLEPVEAVRPQAEEIGFIANRAEERAAEHLHRDGAAVRLEMQFHGLGGIRQVGDDEDRLVRPFSEIRENSRVGRLEEAERPPPEGPRRLPYGDDPPHPREPGRGSLHLRLDVDGLIPIYGIRDH